MAVDIPIVEFNPKVFFCCNLLVWFNISNSGLRPLKSRPYDLSLGISSKVLLKLVLVFISISIFKLVLSLPTVCFHNKNNQKNIKNIGCYLPVKFRSGLSFLGYSFISSLFSLDSLMSKFWEKGIRELL